MSGHWRRVTSFPIASGGNALAVQRYIVMALGPNIQSHHVSTYEEAQTIATHLRTTDAQIVTVARVEDAWKRQ